MELPYVFHLKSVLEAILYDLYDLIEENQKNEVSLQPESASNVREAPELRRLHLDI